MRNLTCRVQEQRNIPDTISQITIAIINECENFLMYYAKLKICLVPKMCLSIILKQRVNLGNTTSPFYFYFHFIYFLQLYQEKIKYPTFVS